MRGQSVYLAGPTTGQPERNLRAFLEAAGKLTQRGYSVVLPADVGDVWTTACRRAAPSFAKLTAAVGEDMDAVLGVDLVVTLPGSEDLFEAILARTFGVPIRSLASYEEDAQVTMRFSPPPGDTRRLTAA